MNNNKLLLAGLAVVVVVLAGVVFLGTKGNNTANPVTQNQETNTVPTAAQEQMTKTDVAVTAQGFEPKTVTIKTGGKVVWTNNSGTAVTVNSALHPTHLLFPFLNLGEFSNGSTIEAVFDKPGIYKYHNHLNPDQTGSVIVE